MKIEHYGHQTLVWEEVDILTKSKELLIAVLPNSMPGAEVLKLYPTASSITYVHHGAHFTLKL